MIINFDNIGGGGGGGYVLPVASQSTLGGVKIGSGITIDSGGTISVSGGSSDENYIIADALSAITDPTEGQMATVKSTTGATVWTKIQISDYQSFTENTGGVPEDFLARIHWGDWDSATQGEEDLLALNVYQSSADFYWNFENDGKQHTMGIERDGVYYNIAYKTYNDSSHPENCYFLFRQIDATPYGDFNIKLHNYVGSAETAETYIVAGGTYVYTQGKWTPINSVYFLPDAGFSTSAETIAFVQTIKADYARGIYPQLYHRGYIFNPTPIDINGSMIIFESLHNYNTSWTAYLSDSNGYFGDNGFNEAGYRFDQNAIASDPSTLCFYIGPNGDFWGYRSASELYDEGTLYKMAVKGCEIDFSAEYGFGSIVYARKITVSDVTTYTWSFIVPTDTGVMKGVWHTTDLSDTNNYVLDSWTAL